MATPSNDQPGLLQYLPIALAFVLIIGFALLQGKWSDRWTDPTGDAAKLVPRMASLPLVLGDWEGEEQEADLRELTASGAVGHVTRSYRHRRSGQHVSLFLVCGHSRDISVHTPDRCYPAAGFTQLETPIKHAIEIEGRKVEFYTTTFRKETPEGTQRLRVFWTWGHDGRWQAPDWPRRTFGGLRALVKLYLVSTTSQGRESIEDSPGLDLARELLPSLDHVLNVDNITNE